MRVDQALDRAIHNLIEGGLTLSPRLEAEVLLADLLEVDRLRLRTHSETALTADQVVAYDIRVGRRAAREPVAHILGYRDFHRYRFQVSPAVLIPRPETEQIIDLVTTDLRPPAGARILDLCTGSGCIGITLLKELSEMGRPCKVVLTDISNDALIIARKNLLQIAPELSRQCRLFQGDLDEALPDSERAAQFTMIVSNPPYIGRDEAVNLEPEVRDHEPALALFHEDPPGLYRRIFAAARDLLVEDGTLILELGPRYASQLLAMAQEFFVSAAATPAAELRKDYAGLDRILVAKKPRA